MANEAVEKAVDDLIRKGRIGADLRNEYIAHFESSLQNDILRGADYTNKTKQLADERRQAEQWLQAERTKIQTERNRLNEWQGQVKGELDEYNKVLRDLPEMTAKIAAYEQTLKDYQILDQVSLPVARPTPSYQPPTPSNPASSGKPAEVSGFSKEDAGRALAEFAVLQGRVNRIAAQHTKLFGEPLDDDLVSHYLTTGEDPEQHWRLKYGVDRRRAEIEATAREQERTKIREEERAKLMAEYSSDPTRVVGAPGVAPRGGLTPLMDQYAHSRATAWSQNHANDDPAPKSGEFVPPEKRPEIQMSRERVAAASEMFMRNFDPMGNPVTDEGKKLYNKHLGSSTA